MKTFDTMFSPRLLLVSLLTGSLCCLLTTRQHAQTVFQTSPGTNNVPGYAGEAAAAFGFFILAPGGMNSIGATTLLSFTGDVQEASALEGMVTSGSPPVETPHATVIGQNGLTSSQASVANVSLIGCSNFFSPGTTTITADFVLSEADAACSTNGLITSGRSQVSGLAINGQPVSVTGQANQSVALPGGGFAILNEQTPGQASVFVGDKTLTATGLVVNAMHVWLPCNGFENVVYGTSAAGIGCGFTTNEFCGDFVTGGGWIRTTMSGAKANFGVAGGIKNGAFWGHLDYVDHGNGSHVKSSAVTGYQTDPSDAHCRIVNYDVTINGDPGTAQVRVCDNGESGDSDGFEIHLSTGYSAGGVLGGSQPGGGDIQIHHCQ